MLCTPYSAIVSALTELMGRPTLSPLMFYVVLLRCQYENLTSLCTMSIHCWPWGSTYVYIWGACVCGLSCNARRRSEAYVGIIYGTSSMIVYAVMSWLHDGAPAEHVASSFGLLYSLWRVHV